MRGSAQFWQAARRGESLTFHGGGLALSGEAELAMNWGVVDSSERDGALLRRLVAHLRSRGLPAYLLFSGPVAPALREVALELGLEDADRIPLMLRDARPLATDPSATLAVSRVENEQDLHRFAGIAAEAFEVSPAAVERAFDPLWLRLPDVDVFLGRSGDVPVCGCVTTRTGGWTGVWAVATASAHTRRGYATSLLSAVIERQRAKADLFYLNAMPLGAGVYKRLGFRAIDEADEWDVTSS